MEVVSEEHLAKATESAPLTDGKEDSAICNHFSIRGYVAEVRKKDSRICWPLFMPYSDKSDIPASVLPPLHVSKFKRWSCTKCLHSLSTSIDVTRNPDLSDVENKEIKPKHPLLILNGKGKTLFYSSKQFSENIIPDGRTVSDFSNNIRYGNCSTDPCHGKKGNGSVTDVAKKGLRLCISGNFNSEENQDLSCKPTSALAEDESQARKHQTGKQTVRVRKNNCEIAFLSDDASLPVCEKPDRHASVSSKDERIIRKGNLNLMPDGTDEEGRKMAGVDLSVLKDDAPIAASNTVNDDLIALEHSNDEASCCNMDLLIYTNCRNSSSFFSDSHGKLNQKKVRKLRFLDDIIKSEEIHIRKKIHTSKENAGTSHVKNNCEGGSDGSKRESQLVDRNRNSVTEHSKLAHLDSSDGIEANHNKDEEISLMRWLKKVSKKLATDDSHKKKSLIAKEYPEVKERENKVGASPCRRDKDTVTWQQAFNVSKQNKMCIIEKENKVSQAQSNGDCFMPQQENWICKDMMVKHVHPGNTFPKMKSINSASILLPITRNLDKSSHKKARRKKKPARIEGRISSQTTCSQKEMVKKQRTTKTHEKETADDIPMDIVELLAKNQHERNLTKIDIFCKNQHEFQMTAGGVIRHGNDSSISGYCGKEASNAIHRSHFIANKIGNVDSTTFNGNQNADCETCRSMECGKHILIDLNQQASDFLTVPQYDRHIPCTIDFPDLDFKKMHYLQNSSWDRLRLQDFGSFQKNHGVSSQSSTGGLHCVLSSPFECRNFADNTTNIDAYSNYRKMIRHDPFSDRGPVTVARDTESLLPVVPTNSYCLNNGGKSEQSTNGTLAGRQYLMEGKSTFHSGDLHDNESVSALHLLRLVESASSSWNVNSTGNIQDSILHECTGMRGVKNGSKILTTPENSLAVVYTACDQNGRLSKPHRPVPRIGTLGPLLQKEIMSQSNIASLASKGSYSDHLPSFYTDRVEYSEIAINSGNVERGHSGIASSRQKVNGGDSLLHEFKTRHILISEKDELTQSGRHGGVSLTCIINENPADFSLPDEDNIYMRGVEDQCTKSQFPCYKKGSTYPRRSSLYETHGWKKRQKGVTRNRDAY